MHVTIVWRRKALFKYKVLLILTNYKPNLYVYFCLPPKRFHLPTWFVGTWVQLSAHSLYKNILTLQLSNFLTYSWMNAQKNLSLSLLLGYDRWLSCPLQLCWKTVGAHRVFVKWSIYMCRMQSKGLCDSVFPPPEIQLFEILYAFYFYFYEVNFWKEKDFFRNEWGNAFLFL